MENRLPIWLAMFLGALGWCITHVVDRITSSPAVEYSISGNEKRGADGTSIVNVELFNLSSSISHRELVVLLVRESKDSAVKFSPKQCEIIAIAPTSLGSSERAECDLDVAEFRADVLPPQGRIELRAAVHGEGKVLIVGGPSASKSDSSYYLAPRNIETIFAKHEFAILSISLIIWVVVMGGLELCKRLKNKKQGF